MCVCVCVCVILYTTSYEDVLMIPQDLVLTCQKLTNDIWQIFKLLQNHFISMTRVKGDNNKSNLTPENHKMYLEIGSQLMMRKYEGCNHIFDCMRNIL